MVKTKVAEPSTPLDLSIPGYNEAFEDQLVHKLVGRIQDSKRPMILIDAFAAGFCVNAEINDLVRETDFPTLATPGGKGVVDEHLPNFHGVHLGSAGTSAHQAWAGARDLVLHFGPLNSDTNTFGFTAIPNPQVTVAFERHSVQIGGTDEILTGGCSISIKATLNKLLARLRTLRRSAPDPYPNECQTPREALRKLPKPRDESAVDQYSFWLLISTYIKSGDIVLTETGTASYGSHSLILPGETVAINSTIWLSIGYMLAACQGASLAQKEMCEAGTRRPGRTILFVGDGSLQMSAQAVSDMIRNRLNVTIFILNNNGYTIERLIHGPNATYNDVQPWRNLEAPSYFGAPKDEPSYPVRTFAAQNWGELQKIINNAGLKKGNGLNMVEVKMGVDDAPQSLRSFAEYLEMRNRGEV
ncbi:Thiamine pyrophosphate enzyme, central domain protein [Cordyceps fumosorosea ARSEF 2679]|uniref:Pyruvate decarboxylase n=1 Tax=Cordyceps fumosorosea (strain ARSEF 2679) TaxID=1081104 RepID=A0A167M422_CORFA|nr:Thiamine pyrophosphate enzyme, central domain protein [Cordyceps fumosorosea ARSEF 2679]OAA53899.1 Thiamine pyrophosphate enzyme, central domain protein [Cordyceps fumosorosea ARSEF 2679]